MSIEVAAPMQGKILEILVKVGDQVNCEDELMLLEALKMENPIYAPADGKVVEIRVSSGATVQAEQVLIVLE